MMRKLEYLSIPDYYDLPADVVELRSGTLRLKDGRVMGVESLHRDIIASGVEVWQPKIAGRKRFAIRQVVFDAVQMWLDTTVERYDAECGVAMMSDSVKLVGYADLSLCEYLQRLLSEDKDATVEPD